MVEGCGIATVWLDDRREPQSTLDWEGTICMRSLGKSSEKLNNEEMLSIINLREAITFRARI
jgi:hypothetical protein